jgi:hypothetical protein
VYPVSWLERKAAIAVLNLGLAFFTAGAAIWLDLPRALPSLHSLSIVNSWLISGLTRR